MLAFLVLIETAALHLLLVHVVPLLAYAVSTSNLSLIIWLIADYRALGRETVRLDGDSVALSLGLRVRGTVPRAAIARAVAPIWGRDLGAAAPPVLNATKPTTPNVLLEFTAPQTLTVAGLVRRPVRRLAFNVDHADDLLKALSQGST